MDVIIEIGKSFNNGFLLVILIIATSPIYFPALGVYFICLAVADETKRGSGKGNFYADKEGLKPFEYYISFGGGSK